MVFQLRCGLFAKPLGRLAEFRTSDSQKIQSFSSQLLKRPRQMFSHAPSKSLGTKAVVIKSSRFAALQSLAAAEVGERI